MSACILRLSYHEVRRFTRAFTVLVHDLPKALLDDCCPANTTVVKLVHNAYVYRIAIRTHEIHCFVEIHASLLYSSLMSTFVRRNEYITYDAREITAHSWNTLSPSLREEPIQLALLIVQTSNHLATALWSSCSDLLTRSGRASAKWRLVERRTRRSAAWSQNRELPLEGLI